MNGRLHRTCLHHSQAKLKGLGRSPPNHRLSGKCVSSTTSYSLSLSLSLSHAWSESRRKAFIFRSREGKLSPCGRNANRTGKPVWFSFTHSFSRFFVVFFQKQGTCLGRWERESIITLASPVGAANRTHTHTHLARGFSFER